VSINSKSPQLIPIIHIPQKRLIDNGMLHYEASLSGFAERYERGVTSHTIHVWWARRPHSAMRALVFASIFKGSSNEAMEILKKLSLSSIVQEDLLSEARKIISSQYSKPPKLLDMFAGGGTIPMESCNLGLDTYSIDSNELSVFIQLCNLVYSQKIDRSKIKEIIRKSGIRIINQLAVESEPLFPLRKKSLTSYTQDSIFGYFWTYSTKCSSCSYRFYLSKRPWLTKKKDKHLAFLIESEEEGQKIRVGIAPKGFKTASVWTGRSGLVKCPKCGAINSNIDIKFCDEKIIGLVKISNSRGKEFLNSTEKAIPNKDYMNNLESTILNELNIDLPKSKLPKWSGIVNPAIYGIETHSDFLNKRQRIVLLLLLKGLRDEYRRLKIEQDECTAKYVIGVLSSFIDQLIDWNCRLSMWIPQNEQVGRAFCGPGVSMLWDYIETDPVLRGPANLWGKLERILSGVQSINKFPRIAHVKKGYAQSLNFPNEFFDAIVTDPPYYDNIFYGVLADFFYVWKRPILNLIEPNLFASYKTDDSNELVASKIRSGNIEKAHSDYCIQLKRAFLETERVLKSDGIFSFIYSHSSFKGWEAIIKAYRSTNFQITSIQPLSIERKQRPRAMTSKAINTCITFVAHKIKKKKEKISMQDLCSRMRIISKDFASRLKNVGWSDSDTALAIFANGVGMLANSSEIIGNKDDLEILQSLELIVKEIIPSFKVQRRKSL